MLTNGKAQNALVLWRIIMSVKCGGAKLFSKCLYLLPLYDRLTDSTV